MIDKWCGHAAAEIDDEGLFSITVALPGIRDGVGFFQGVRAALIKTTASSGRSAADRELAIQQIVSRAVVSTEIVEIMAAAGLDRPDISVLSDEFLAEVRDLDKKNLAIEGLRKLLNGQVHSQGKRNVTGQGFFRTPGGGDCPLSHQCGDDS